MKKRMLSLPLSAWFLLALCACGGGSAPTFDLHTETAYTHIDGLYVDTDYQDPEGQDRHMLYLFYTVYTPDQPLSVRSDATQLTVIRSISLGKDSCRLTIKVLSNRK